MSDNLLTPQWMIEQGCSPKAAQFFFQKVNVNGPIPQHRAELGRCHVWLASITSRGYGQFRPTIAHRFAWMLIHGPIPKGMLCLHKCDNPLCVNADHLFIGTDADNMRDKMLKGRDRTKGESNVSAKLTWSETRMIRQLSQRGWTQRALGKRFGVHKDTIWQIINFKSWLE